MGHPRVLTDEIKDYIRAHSADMTIKEMVTSLGLSYQTVYQFYKKEKIPYKISRFGRKDGVWKGCDRTCPDYCPYPDCILPTADAVVGYEDDFNIRELFERTRNEGTDEREN